MKPVDKHMCDFCFNDKVYLIEVSQQYIQTVEDYNPKTNTWTYKDSIYMNNPVICFECLRTVKDE